jgi:excisionase family DNA binding protein
MRRPVVHISLPEGHPLPESLLNYAEAAELLGTTPRHVRDLQATRRLASCRVGRLVRFRRADLDNYIAANSVPSVRV